MTSSSTANLCQDVPKSTQHESENITDAKPRPSNEQSCLKLKGSLVPMTVLELSRYDAEQINNELKAKTTQAPEFFKNLPVVIDLDKLNEHESVPFTEFIAQCQTFSIKVVAIRGGYDSHQLSAKEAGLAILSKHKEKSTSSSSANSQASGSGSIESTEQTEQADQIIKTVVRGERQQSKVVQHPIRSGQQVYAADGDLIVLSSVSAGAEILADGNIHVYGALRGRALAGVKGDISARIFCHSLQAELVSIAGQYKISEDMDKTVMGKPTQIFLSNDTLSFKELAV